MPPESKSSKLPVESNSELEENSSVSPDKLDNFKEALATFALSPSTPDSDTRKISRLRKRRIFPEAVQSQESFDVEDSNPDIDIGTPMPKKKRRVRKYADPATYAHLQGLPDILADDLDSFTPTKLPSQEDHTLPERFSLGLTNLVERPTAEQNELSSNEQTASVPILLEKVARYRPRVVCFLGLGIAQKFQSQLDFKSMYQGPTKVKVKKSALGLQAYKMVHSSTQGSASDVGKIELFAKLKEFLVQLKEAELQTGDLRPIVLPSSSIGAQ
ncbi:hypothetical protein H0H92_001865 [Tricholoma furcatifolium]|nr:hypothetical protein H0H92_001865 [Tricholoma furcatifolium]